MVFTCCARNSRSKSLLWWWTVKGCVSEDDHIPIYSIREFIKIETNKNNTRPTIFVTSQYWIYPCSLYVYCTNMFSGYFRVDSSTDVRYARVSHLILYIQRALDGFNLNRVVSPEIFWTWTLYDTMNVLCLTIWLSFLKVSEKLLYYSCQVMYTL